MTNLSLYLTESADMYPSAAALGCEGVTTTYSELADQAARFAAYVYEARGAEMKWDKTEKSGKVAVA